MDWNVTVGRYAWTQITMIYAYRENNGEEKWKKFISVKEGITEEDAENLKKEYPLIPDSLIDLLTFADGTYFRDYNGTEINLYLERATCLNMIFALMILVKSGIIV